MQLKRVAPERLAAKGIIAKYLSPLIDHRLGMPINFGINTVLGRWSSRRNSKQCHCAKRRDYQYFRLALHQVAASCNDAHDSSARANPATPPSRWDLEVGRSDPRASQGSLNDSKRNLQQRCQKSRL